MAENRKTIKLATPEATLSFPHLITASKVDKASTTEEPKYNAVFMFDKGTDLKPLLAAVIEVGRARWGKDFDTMLKAGTMRSPIKVDGNPKFFKPGEQYISPRSKNKPGLVMPYPDENGKPALCQDPEIFYAGARVRASITAYPYDVVGNKGVAFGLNSVQWVGDGPRLDGGDPQNDFDTLQEAPMDGEEASELEELLG